MMSVKSDKANHCKLNFDILKPIGQHAI